MAMLLLSGCGGTFSTSSSDDAGGADREGVATVDGGAVAPDDGAVEGEVDGGDSSGAGNPPGRAGVQSRAVVVTGQVELRADDLGKVRREVDRLVGRYGGYVADEETFNDATGRTEYSRVELRVPSPRFEDVMSAFEDIATVTSATRQAEDVTTEVIDVEARIRTQEVSLRRLRAFLGRSADLDSVIRLESEIAQREATLESLKAQQSYLADQTSLATIVVSMDRPGSPERAEERWQDGGFLAGLSSGWDALQAAFVVSMTVLGALLPFLVLLGAVLVPGYLWGRRLRKGSQPQAPSSPQAPTADVT